MTRIAYRQLNTTTAKTENKHGRIRTRVGLRMRMTWVTGVDVVTRVPEAGIICSWNVLGTAAWKRKSLSEEPYELGEAVNVAITKLGLSAGRSKARSTRRPFFS